MTKRKIGDEVNIECQSSMGTGGPDKITDITTQYDVHTGKPYEVIWCGNRKFHSKTGEALNEPWAYYIED
jgi:hypothetical protein